MITFLFDLLVATVFLVMLCVLVAAHEYGHYLFARMFGMGVEEFAIGMGKRLKIWKEKSYDIPVDESYVHNSDEVSRGAMFEGGDIPALGELIEAPSGRILREKTEFTLRMLPVGGFVRIKGMIPQDDGSEVRTPGGFYSKPPWQRLVVLAGGPLFSVLAGLIILTVVFCTFGTDKPNLKPVLGMVSTAKDKDTLVHAAEDAGLKEGDVIVSVNKEPISTFYQFVHLVNINPNKPLQVVYSRDGKETETTLTPGLGECAVFLPNLQVTGDRKVQGRIGVSPQSLHVVLGFKEAAAEAFTMPVDAVQSMFRLIAQPSRIKDEAGGAVTMVRVTSEVVKEGIGKILWWAGALSILVGVFNLMPIPPLDGGQMVMALAEMLRGGRRLSMRVQQAVLNTGIAMVLLLFVVVLAIDVNRWFIAPGQASQQKPAVQTPKK
jgi:regulator of sigma E protease